MKKKKEQTGIYYTIIFFIAVVLVFPLISDNYIIGHDTYYHLTNIEVFKKMILHLNFSKVIPIIGFNVGYVGMVNSHLVCSIFFTIPLLLFILINIKKFITKENIKDILIASLIIIVLIMPSLIMMIEHKNSNMYVVFDNKLMGTTLAKIKSHAVGKKE